MTAVDDIGEKLKRADEHINQLELEVNAFLDKAPHKTIINDKSEAVEAFKDFHRNRIVDARLSVLVGDALHQIRSSLDHLVCALIRRDGGKPNGASQFPICAELPTTKDATARYEQQIAGIKRPEARAAIERLQPYNRSNPSNHWLHVLKGFSNRDKHRALVLTVVWIQPRFRAEMKAGPMHITSAGPDDGTAIPGRWTDPDGEVVEVVKVERRIVTDVAFEKWGDGTERIDVVRGLRGLLTCVSEVVAEFKPFL